jgi:hypothetical protein
MSFSFRAPLMTFVTLVLIAGCQAGPDAAVHGDDEEHPMALLAGGGSFASSADGRVPGGTWTTTFGSIFPCVANGPGPLVIDSVDWASDDGQDPLSVQVYLRTFDDSALDPVGSLRGAPLDTGNRDSMGTVSEQVEGFKVERSCATAPDKGLRDELLVTATAGDRGAQIADFTVRYTTPDGKKYAVVSDWDMYICGTEVPEELCDGDPET